MDKAIKLRERWVAKGNPPCDHPHLDEECYSGAQTGDYVCTTCGECFASCELGKDPKTLKMIPKSR